MTNHPTDQSEARALDTVAFVQEWLMNADYDPTQFDRDFAAAIDARCLAFAARPAGEVERLREAEGVARRWAEHYAGGDGEQRRMERLCDDIADEIAALQEPTR